MLNGRRDINEINYQWVMYLDFKIGKYLLRGYTLSTEYIPPPTLNLTALKNCSYWLENGWRDINEPIFQWVIYLDFKSCPTPLPPLLLFGANSLTTLENFFYWLLNGRRDNNEPIYEWAIQLDFKS